MKAKVVFVTLVILALAVPAQMLAQMSKAEQEVRAVIDELNQSFMKGGATAITAVEKYTADDYVRITPGGAIYNKADMVNGWKNGTIKVDAINLTDLKIHLLGNTAVATAISNGKVTVLGDTYDQTRWTRVFVKRGGVWKCVLYQNTAIKKS